MSFTASGARRAGDEYQDLQSAELLVQWLEQPDRYRWVRLETMDGALDDIQAELGDGTRRLLQVKFATDPRDSWDWDTLIRQEPGARGLKPSLLQRWKTSLDDARRSGVSVSEAALITNRDANPEIRAHLSDQGHVRFASLSPSLQTRLSAQLGGTAEASSFFASFHFYFGDRALETLHDGLLRRFHHLGGTREGWTSLLRAIRRWINHRDEPSPDGTIRLEDVRREAHWHRPRQIPQGFAIPDDYVAPAGWSDREIWPRLTGGDDRIVVVTGTPGVGKSTYLSWLVERLREANVPVVRHHYFLSLTDATTFRTASRTAAETLIEQLRSTYPLLLADAGQTNPVPEKLPQYLAAAGRARPKTSPLVVIVDGLDHVWRDTGSADELRQLFDLLLPVPAGVVLVVGTQAIDRTFMPPKLRECCPPDQWLALPRLSLVEVREWISHHAEELPLPERDDARDWMLGELAAAFDDLADGHPLILHYTLNSARQAGIELRPDRIRTLTGIERNSPVTSYYQRLWDAISSQGHQMLHLLAGFEWAWPSDGLIQCLATIEGLSRVEEAERDVRHVLGETRAGVTAFHESLLAFVRARPEHRAAVATLRRPVIEWLKNDAPDYWQWRYSWELQAVDGKPQPLIAGPTLDWCVRSLVAGRSRADIAAVVSASGWAALASRELGAATERHFLDDYLHAAGDAPDVLGRLAWLALRTSTPECRDRELDISAAHRSKKSVAELGHVAEAAFAVERLDICEELLDECVERWNVSRTRGYREHETLTQLARYLPTLLAATTPGDDESGPFRRHLADDGNEPRWCPSDVYARALAVHCVVGESTRQQREELRFLTNHPTVASIRAADELVRLGCREDWDPEPWVVNAQVRRSGLLRCYQIWVTQGATTPYDPPREVSFAESDHEPGIAAAARFIERAREYFFFCLACAIEGCELPEPTGLSPRASGVAEFLSLLAELAADAAAASEPVDGAWWLTRLRAVEPFFLEILDVDNMLAAPEQVRRIVVAIAQDLEELSHSATKRWSLDAQVMEAALASPWTTARVWIDERVNRRLRMGVPCAAKLLIARERDRLASSREDLHTRASEYVTLAQFCALHDEPAVEAATLAARNLLGHGYHKDLVLNDILESVRAVPEADKQRTLARLHALSPIVQVINEITDGDETRYLLCEFAEAVEELADESLGPYLRALQRADRHWDIERYFTHWAKQAPLASDYDRALAQTLVHEEALQELHARAQGGDVAARDVLAATLAFCGRQAVDENASRSTSEPPKDDYGERHVPAPSDYPPSRLADFVSALREAREFGDEHVAAWAAHWRRADPDGLLAALTEYRKAHGQPPERKSFRLVVELAGERRGQTGAWEWLIAYHEAMFGWQPYMYPIDQIRWFWDVLHARFPKKWLEFVQQTARQRWRPGGAPNWSAERMVRFLAALGETKLAADVVDAAVAWGAGLAANMRLPEPALTPDRPLLPLSLRLLVDRLDCPSRMVQERAGSALAALLAAETTREETVTALLDWHAADALESRSCMLVLVLLLARYAHGITEAICMAVLRRFRLTPSIGLSVLLREFGPEGQQYADALDYRKCHTGGATGEFPRVEDFDTLVDTHLAPIVHRWARKWDDENVPFSLQWEREAAELSRQVGRPLTARHVHHYSGDARLPALPFSDHVSLLLRSSYLRALHWCIEQRQFPVERAEIDARAVGPMADPTLWAIGPGARPAWWPAGPRAREEREKFHDAVYKEVVTYLERASAGDEIPLFIAGPVGAEPRLSVQLTIRAFLQSAYGPFKPTSEELAEVPSISSRPIPPRLTAPGAYIEFSQTSGMLRDWLVAPLAWNFHPDTQNWLMPARQSRGLHVPATWLFPGSPTLAPAADHLAVVLGDDPVGRYSYWHDDLRERENFRAVPRAGGELLLHRKWLAPHLSTGAQLCWVATLVLAERGEYQRTFDEPRLAASWVIGGSRIVHPKPWRPPCSHQGSAPFLGA